MKTFLEKTFTKNKKGSHVDWAISIGIFLIYLISLFILLRPGIEESYEQKAVMEMLESNFKKEVTWTVKEIPLFIDICKPNALGVPCTINVDVIGDWKFSKSILIGPEGKDYGTGVTIVCEGSQENPNLDEGRRINLFAYNNNKNPGEIGLTVSPGTESCSASLGVTENIDGVNEDWLSNLDLSIPEEVGFSIKEGENLIAGSEEDIKQANVFVRDWKTRFLTDGGDTSEVVEFKFKIW